MKLSDKYILIVSVLLLFSAITTVNIFAQEEPEVLPENLGNHKFMNNSTIGTAFTNTHYKSLLGAGMTLGLEIPPIVINNKPVAQLNGDIAYTNLFLEYQQEIKDWMAFYGAVKLIGRLGTKTGALISTGVNLAAGYNLGWKFRVFRNKNMVLSSNLNLANISYTAVDMQRFIQNVIDSGKITPDNKLVQSVPLVRGGVGLNYAYAINETFGVQARLYVDYGESVSREDDDVFNYAYGASFEADLNPKLKVPLGFLAGFYHSSVPQFREQPKSNPNELLFQINYTGKEYISIGAEINYQWYKPEKFESSIKFITASLNSTIYF